MLADPAGAPGEGPAAGPWPRASTIVRDAMLAEPEMVARPPRPPRHVADEGGARPGHQQGRHGGPARHRDPRRARATGIDACRRRPGLAVKIEDGDGYDRGTWAASIEALRQTGVLDGAALRALARYHRPTILDPHGRVGAEAVAEFELAPVGELIG